MDKQLLRREIRARKETMTPEEIAEESARLCALFLNTAQYRNARTVYGYASYNQEVRTDAVLQQALLDGKRVALPKILDGEMRFFYLNDLSQRMPGFRGIPEPVGQEEAQDENALVLVPGLAFDAKGYRVGYGGGFYDRFLRREPNHPTVAMCYRFQMVTAIDAEEFDVPVDLVLV